MAKTDRDYEREAAQREFDYFQEQDEREQRERLGAKNSIEHSLPGRGPADDEAGLAQPYSDGKIIGKGLGPQDRFRGRDVMDEAEAELGVEPGELRGTYGSAGRRLGF